MSRPLRLEFPGAFYHVTSRGNARAEIFDDDDDRNRFLAVLGETTERYGWLCHAYCLMDNHYHLLIETPDPNLSLGMRHLNGVYTQRFNRRHGRVGHIFQGRFKAIVVDRDSYLMELARYIVLNPVRARMTKDPARFAWSSYRATAGLAAAPDWLTTQAVLGQFAKTRAVARRRYAEFVAAGKNGASPWSQLKGQMLLGPESFVERMTALLEGKGELREIPRSQRMAHRPSLKSLFPKAVRNDKPARDAAIREAHGEHGYTMAEIGRAAGVHYSTVSRVIMGTR